MQITSEIELKFLLHNTVFAKPFQSKKINEICFLRSDYLPSKKSEKLVVRVITLGEPAR